MCSEKEIGNLVSRRNLVWWLPFCGRNIPTPHWNSPTIDGVVWCWCIWSCCRGKAISTKYYECLSVALVIQHAPYYIIICSLSGCTIFLHILINDTIFGKTLLDIKYVFWFSLQVLSETFLILRRIERDIIINVYRCFCIVSVILVRF
jgi:hypothetical protein